MGVLHYACEEHAFELKQEAEEAHEYIQRLEARIERLEAAAERTVKSLGRCTADPLNPCWYGRPGDKLGKHWGGGEACAYCWTRAALAGEGG